MRSIEEFLWLPSIDLHYKLQSSSATEIGTMRSIEEFLWLPSIDFFCSNNLLLFGCNEIFCRIFAGLLEEE